jgi:predicted secreted protein
MSTVKGSNFTIYTGDGLRALGCEESCTLTINTEYINVTTKGSGGDTSGAIGRSDWSVSSTGVVSMNAVFDGSGTNLDPTEFMAYQLQGNKVVVKAQFTDGTTSKWLIGTGIVVSSSYTGGGEGFMTFDVQIKGDGKLFQSSGMQTTSNYDGPSIYVFDATSTVIGFTATALIGASIYFINRTKSADNVTYLTADVQSLAGSGTSPSGINTVGLHSASGTVNFDDDLVSGNRVIVVYDPA